jgi:tetratricopeptide (TPR) repeat protein
VEKDINQTLKKAITAHKEGKLNEAVRLYQKIIKTQPIDPQIHHNIGVALKELGSLEDAILSFKEALRLKSDYIIAYYNLGATLNQLKKFDEAKIYLNKAIMLKPDFAEAQNILGSTLHNLGKLDEAQICIKKAIMLKPDFVNAYYNLGIILNQIEKFDEAEAIFRKIIKLNPNFGEVYNELGIALYHLGRLQESETNYKKCIEFRPDFAEVYNNLGNTIKELGRFEEAEINCKKAIELKPNYTKARMNLNLIIQEKKLLDILQLRNSKKNKLLNLSSNIGLTSNPFIFNRDIEPQLLSNLYKIKSTIFSETEGGPLYGIGRTTNYNLFENDFPILKNVEVSLTSIMKQAVKSDIFIRASFLNILEGKSGSIPHAHITNFDKTQGLINRKFSLVYYIDVGDQNSSEPGIFKLQDPNQEILPHNGMIIIIPADRKHSAIYNGKTDRVMIGVNFYSLQ